MRIQEKSIGTQRERSSEFRLQSFQHAVRGILMLAFLSFLVPSSLAQSNSQLNGIVSDPSGANIPSATITLTDSATGLERSTTTGASGLYQFLDVPPGTYLLQAIAKGFAHFAASNVTLVVKTPLTINIKLQLAGAAETVNVQDIAPLINRTDASLGNTLEQDQIAQLPIADRNVVQLLSLQPGVAYLGTQSDPTTDTRSGAVNGVRSDQSNVTLDSI